MHNNWCVMEFRNYNLLCMNSNIDIKQVIWRSPGNAILEDCYRSCNPLYKHWIEVGSKPCPYSFHLAWDTPTTYEHAAPVVDLSGEGGGIQPPGASQPPKLTFMQQLRKWLSKVIQYMCMTLSYTVLRSWNSFNIFDILDKKMSQSSSANSRISWGGAKILYDVEIFFVSSPPKLKSIHVLNGTKAWYACTYWTLNQ